MERLQQIYAGLDMIAILDMALDELLYQSTRPAPDRPAHPWLDPDDPSPTSSQTSSQDDVADPARDAP